MELLRVSSIFHSCPTAKVTEVKSITSNRASPEASMATSVTAWSILKPTVAVAEPDGLIVSVAPLRLTKPGFAPLMAMRSFLAISTSGLLLRISASVTLWV